MFIPTWLIIAVIIGILANVKIASKSSTTTSEIIGNIVSGIFWIIIIFIAYVLYLIL